MKLYLLRTIFQSPLNDFPLKAYVGSLKGIAAFPLKGDAIRVLNNYFVFLKLEFEMFC